MPVVRIELAPGRTHAQKARYVEEVTRLTVDILKVPVETVDVVFIEVPLYDWAHAGQFYGAPPESK